MPVDRLLRLRRATSHHLQAHEDENQRADNDAANPPPLDPDMSLKCTTIRLDLQPIELLFAQIRDVDWSTCHDHDGTAESPSHGPPTPRRLPPFTAHTSDNPPMLRPLQRFFARRWLPMSLRLRGMRLAYMRMLGTLAHNPDPTIRAAVVSASTDLGIKLAADLKRELGLGDSLEDADAAWAIGCQAFGLSHTRTESDNTITYDHTGCEIHAFYAAKGECHCETICLPMVQSVTATLAPSVTIAIDRMPDVSRGCRKTLRSGH